MSPFHKKNGGLPFTADRLWLLAEYDSPHQAADVIQPFPQPFSYQRKTNRTDEPCQQQEDTAISVIPCDEQQE